MELALNVERELERQEVILMEEQERERRIRAEKTKAADYTGHFSEQQQELHRELLSKADSKEVTRLEEEERKRRIVQEQREQKQEDSNAKFASDASRIIARRLEEEERQRRYVSLPQLHGTLCVVRFFHSLTVRFFSV